MCKCANACLMCECVNVQMCKWSPLLAFFHKRSKRKRQFAHLHILTLTTYLHIKNVNGRLYLHFSTNAAKESDNLHICTFSHLHINNAFAHLHILTFAH